MDFGGGYPILLRHNLPRVVRSAYPHGEANTPQVAEGWVYRERHPQANRERYTSRWPGVTRVSQSDLRRMREEAQGAIPESEQSESTSQSEPGALL